MAQTEFKVLIVDDEPRLRDLLSRAMPAMGFTASTARSAEEALKLLDVTPHDILILDLNLPGQGGMELFKTLRQRWPRMQVIILTGFGDLDAAKEAIRLDVVDFLTKPCHLGELELAIDRARRRITQGREPASSLSAPWPADNNSGTPPTLGDLERQHILEALERNHGNRTATAAELGISLRTLYYRITEYQKQGYRVD